MPAGISKAKGRRSSKSKASAFSRAKANMPAKAGKRKGPVKEGPHTTNAEDRNRASWLASFGVKPYAKPQGWVVH